MSQFAIIHKNSFLKSVIISDITFAFLVGEEGVMNSGWIQDFFQGVIQPQEDVMLHTHKTFIKHCRKKAIVVKIDRIW
jgi:hypothetical protein